MLDRQQRAAAEVKQHRADKRAVGSQNRLRAAEDSRAKDGTKRMGEAEERHREEKEKREAKHRKAQQFRQQCKLQARALDSGEAVTEAEAASAADGTVGVRPAPPPKAAATFVTVPGIRKVALGPRGETLRSETAAASGRGSARLHGSSAPLLSWEVAGPECVCLRLSFDVPPPAALVPPPAGAHRGRREVRTGEVLIQVGG